jgi:hypothetical protein
MTILLQHGQSEITDSNETFTKITFYSWLSFSLSHLYN